MSILAKQVKPVIILTASKTGAFKITKVYIECIVPTGFILLVKAVYTKQCVQRQRKFVSTCCPVGEGTLCEIEVENTTSSPGLVGCVRILLDGLVGFDL